MDEFTLADAAVRVVRRRTRRDPKPRFLPDQSAQLDGVNGCAQVAVARDHLAWRVREMVEANFDVTSIESSYSSLGRRGHSPQRLLAVWIYASLIGMHYATVVERACKTDAAFRLLSGGRTISATVLKRFRANNAGFFASALERTVTLAREAGLLRLQELATDSMRLIAHASKSAVRTRKRANERLGELERVDESVLSEQEREAHQAAVARYRAVLAACAERDRASVVSTNAMAALMKFPDGGSRPGHRVTVTASGASERIVVGVLVDSDANDVGKLPAAIEQTLGVLERAGVPSDARLRVVADAGYFDAVSLDYAERVQGRVDILIADALTKPQRHREKFFARDRFTIADGGRSVVCPAGRLMQGPESAGRGKKRWIGSDCATCDLKPQCTPHSRRKFVVRDGYEENREHMRRRLATEEAITAYRKRAAIIEPVFASLESDMRYRRTSSRRAATVIAEVLLKLLAHNIARLFASSSLRVVWFMVRDDGTLSLGNAQK